MAQVTSAVVGKTTGDEQVEELAVDRHHVRGMTSNTEQVLEHAVPTAQREDPTRWWERTELQRQRIDPRREVSSGVVVAGGRELCLLGR